MDRPSLHRLFLACDVNKSGVIEYEDFTVVCRELGVPAGETQTLFDRFDADRTGFINYRNFSSSFAEVSETLDLASFVDGASGPSSSPLDDFLSRVDGAVHLPESLRGPLGDLYQALQSSADVSLVPRFEHLLLSLVSDSVDHRLQSEQLESSLRRTEEMNSSQLAELEDDMQEQLAAAERHAREEERRRMEGVMAALQKKHEDELADLRGAVEEMLKSREESERNHSREDAERLSRQIRDLTQDNEQLRSSLVKAQTNISVLHSELDKLKNMYADQKDQHVRESDELKRMVVEYQSYASEIVVLQAMNKRLYDSNDGLRSALANDVGSAKRKLPPQTEIPARRMKPLRQSTLNQSSPEQDTSKMSYAHVVSWADKYLDSGLPMDIAESSEGSDYDSDESGQSVETLHHSYSYVLSDVEVSEVKSELSVAPSKASSIASSVRRRLSAFSMKPTGTSTEELEAPIPMYRLVLAGDAGTGKSSFLMRLSLNEFRGDIQTTLGVDFQIKKMLVDGEKTSLQIWDTAGQERFRSLARSYFRKAQGVLLLYDVTSESSFLNVRAWVDEIQETTEERIPMCIIGSKVDLREELPEGSCVSAEHGERLAKTYGALFCETSAKEGTNIVEAVLHLAREVKKRVKLRPQAESQVRLSSTNPKKTLNNCCGL